MSETLNRPVSQFEINPNATPEGVIETSVNLLATSIEAYLGVEGQNELAQKVAPYYVPNLIRACLPLGLDPSAYIERFQDAFARAGGCNPADQGTALACALIYSGELDLNVMSQPTDTIAKKWRKWLATARKERMVYDGHHEEARKAAIAEIEHPIREEVADNSGFLSACEKSFGRDAEALYTLRLAWQGIEASGYKDGSVATEAVPSALMSPYESDDPPFHYFRPSAHHVNLLLAHQRLATVLDDHPDLEDAALHRAARYIQQVYTAGGDLHESVAAICSIVRCAEAGPLEDALMLQDLFEAHSSSLRRTAPYEYRDLRKGIDLALAQRFTQIGDFDQADALLAPYPRGGKAASQRAFLLARQGGVAQAIAATCIPATHKKNGVYALKQIMQPAAEATAAYDIKAAVKMLDSIAWGWGHDWTRLKPALDQSISHSRLYTIAGQHSDALAALNGAPVTELIDALFILRTLEPIALAIARKAATPADATH